MITWRDMDGWMKWSWGESDERDWRVREFDGGVDYVYELRSTKSDFNFELNE